MKKLLKKAMVFTLAAAMLVGTPLTASAAPLNSVYSITDHWGEQKDDGDDKSHTGTVTNTVTTSNSGVLKDNETKIIGIALDKEHVDVEVGGKRETLTATIITDLAPGESLVNKFGEEATEEMLTLIRDMIKWQVQNPDGTIDDMTNKKLSTDVVNKAEGDASTVILNPRQGTKAGEDMIVKVFLDGTYYFTPDGIREELVTNKTEGYSAEATVSIKEYSRRLYWEDEKTESNMYLKHTLDLGEVLGRDPETANDTITWTSTNTSVATVSATGVVTAKKVNWDADSKKYTQTKGKDNVCKIIAVGERKGTRVEREIKVEKGTPATGVAVFIETGDSKNPYQPLTSYTQDLATNRTDRRFLIQTYAKANVAVDAENKLLVGDSADADPSKAKSIKKNVQLMGGDYYVTTDANGQFVQKQMIITDVVTLSTNKPAFASAELTKWNEWGSGDAKVIHKGVGTATITVKTTSNKKASFKVNVKATLGELSIDGVDNGHTLYSGQSVTLTADRTPAESKDAVKWSIAKVNNGKKDIANPNAKINSKGVLTIANKINPDYPEVTIHLESSRAINGSKVVAKDVTIKVAQSSINGITIRESGKDDPVSYYTFKNEKDNKKESTSIQQEISVPLNKTFVATVVPGFGAKELSEDTLAGTLKWTATGNNKIVEIIGSGKNAKIKAIGAGTSTVTVSGIRVTEKNGKANKASVIKTTFKVKVKQPVRSVTMNKPSVVLAYQTQTKKGVTTTKPQKVALKVTLGPKGVNKNEAITWSVSKTVGEADGTAVPQTGKGANAKDTTKTSATFTLVSPEIGDEYIITARTASGASAKSIVKIVKKTQGVQIAQSEQLGEDKKPVPFKEGKKNNTKNIAIGEDFQMFTFVNVGKDARANADWKEAGDSGEDFVAEDVTYSVNKKGIVSIDKDGNVFGLKKGAVTITAKTPMGKKGTLKVNVQ